MIVVNGRFLIEQPTGVQRFATHVVSALGRLRDDVIVLAPPGAAEAALEGVSVQRFGSENALRWEQVDLPMWLNRHGRPLLINLANRAPIVYRRQLSVLHDLIPIHVRSEFSLRFRLQFRAVAWLGVVRGSRFVLTVSEFSRGEILRYYGLDPDRVVTIPNAADEEWLTRVSEPAAVATPEPYVLAFGRSGTNRNVRCVVDAMTSAASDPGVVLVFVGTPDPAIVEASRHLGARCRFIGRVPDAELASLYRSALCFIAPSTYEGFDLPPLEAQQAGTAVIASDIEVHREVLGEGAMYFDPRSPDALFEAVEHIVSDPAQRAALVERGMTNATRFSWQASASRLNQLIRKVSA